MSTDELPDFTTAPAWLNHNRTAWPGDGAQFEVECDPETMRMLAPWTPLDTAEAWRDKIDRDKLIVLLRNEWVDPVWVADTLLAALPELMDGGK